MHNGPLADTLGNLVHRATNLAKKYAAGAVPDVGGSAVYAALAAEKPIDVAALVRAKYGAGSGIPRGFHSTFRGGDGQGN